MKPMLDSTRTKLDALSRALLRLHKCLLDSERAAYERDVARITSTGQYLQLVMGDPWFAWLREISQFIVVIDELLAQKTPVPDEEGTQLLTQARVLLIPSDTGSDFARKYSEAMQRDPAAVLAHGEMMRVLGELNS